MGYLYRFDTMDTLRLDTIRAPPQRATRLASTILFGLSYTLMRFSYCRFKYLYYLCGVLPKTNAKPIRL